MRNKIKDKQMQREKHARHINILGIMRNTCNIKYPDKKFIYLLFPAAGSGR